MSVCRHDICQHTREQHGHVFCMVDGCRCPGWVENAAGTGEPK